MKLRSLAIPFTFLLACSTMSSGSRTPAGEAQHGGGAVTQAAVGARSPAELERLLADYDRLPPDSAERAPLAAAIDQVAGQRYATVSRLFWYDDLGAAKAAARASGKPILSLRMLGRLDEDLSCANSRFFRTTLYPDVAVAKLLHERFVLHWSSERNVPRVTVDFGDGRTIQSTVTGNSAHYVLDADGRLIDVLPGLYSPKVFQRELEVSLTVAAALAGKRGPDRTALLVAHHREQLQAMNARWGALPAIVMLNGTPQIMDKAAMAKHAALAQRATVSKARIEVPILQTVDLGVDPGQLPTDIALWVLIYGQLMGNATDATDGKLATVIDTRSRHLVDSMLAVSTTGERLDAGARAAIIDKLEESIAGDTAINEVRLRPQVRAHLIEQLERGDATFAEVNAWVYANVFHTPAEDQWMGLLPRDTFTGLPGGVVATVAPGR